MLKEIESKEDLELLVNTFYSKIKLDPFLSPIFSLTEEQWQHHLPRMVNFWENWIWQTGSYIGGMMMAHIELNKREKLDQSHFEVWVKIFKSTVDELFTGAHANFIKTKAEDIGQIMLAKINHVNTEEATK